MKAFLTGGPQRGPIITKIDRGKSIQKEIGKRLDSLDHKGALFIDAPPGMGKTHMVGHVLAPWAKDRGMDVLFIGPRIALDSQAKRALARDLGGAQLLERLTDKGLQNQEKIGNVTIITIPRLYALMLSEPEFLRKFGIVIFDEIHLLLDDALFVPCTGFILNRFKDFFGGAFRFYLSATSESILPLLARVEAPYAVEVLKFPSSYSYVHPRFFQDTEELVKRINNDKTSAKWLVYLPTISEGQALRSRLTCPVRLLNRAKREEDPEGWNAVLREEKFDAKVCICTAVVDVGVNFKDPLLRNVVVFSLNPNTIVQFLGRKRRTAAEQIRLYVRCPSQQELNAAMKQVQELLAAVALYRQDYPQFARLHILPSTDRDLRGWLRVTDEGQFELNRLVKENLQVQMSHLEKLLNRARENKGDCHFDRFVAHLLRISLPDRSECWLDPRYSGTAKAKFEQFLSNYIGKPMNEAEFSEFSEQFHDLCIAAHGTNDVKDRVERTWGAKKISNRLTELDNGYMLKVDPVSKIVTLEMSFNAENRE